MDQLKPPSEIIPAAYRQQAASWSDDVHGALRASARRAWWVAGIASVLAALLALALVLLLPLKTVVPYTILVDRQTGHAELARGVNLGPMAENEALLQSALAQYVIARETLDAGDLAANYKKIGLWSKGLALQDYLKGMDRSNPASILNSANAETQIVTTIKSIAVLDKDNALVRFATDRREGGGPMARQDWAAVVRYGFSGAPLSAEDRLINPLGFQVSHYRRDAETAPTSAPETAQ
jgi:type IV secretion system protein VirB8